MWLVAIWLFLSWRLVALVAGNTHLLLARLGWRPRRAPAGYVRALFDDYAGRFDEHLMVDLAYHAPNLVRGLVGERLAGMARRTGFQVEAVRAGVLRTQGDEPVPGEGWLLRRG